MPLGADSLVIGRVLRTHGLDGTVVVALDPDQLGALLAAPRILLDAEPGTIPYRIASVRPLAASEETVRVRLQLVGVESPDRVRCWVGADVRLEAEFLQPLEAGEHLARDLVGATCVTGAGTVVGVVVEIWRTPSVDQLLVDGERGAFFVPARDEVLVGIDLARRRIEIDVGALGFDPAEEIP